MSRMYLRSDRTSDRDRREDKEFSRLHKKHKKGHKKREKLKEKIEKAATKGGSLMLRPESDRTDSASFSSLATRDLKPDLEILMPEDEAEVPQRIEDFDPRKILFNELKDLIRLSVRAKKVYKDLPDSENSMSVVTLLRELRDYTNDIYAITKEDKDGIFESMDARILRPFVTKLIKAVTSEFSSLTRQMILSFGDEHTNDIEKITRASLKNLAPMLATEYTHAIRSAKEILGADVDIQTLVDQVNEALKS